MNDAEKSMKTISRRSFTWAIVVIALVYGLWRWLVGSPMVGGQLAPFRTVLGTNEKVWSSLTKPSRLAPSFPESKAERPRVNGYVGLGADFETANWTMRVEGLPGAAAPLTLHMEDIRLLPQTEFVAEFKCIEGWSNIVKFKGVRFSEFLGHYAPGSVPGGPLSPDVSKLPAYCALETPDGAYYVGIDMPSMLHPQTILCTEMDGKPLPLDQGAPLRLIIPIKYGIKSLKRIGLIRLTNERPKDYWAERGYDYFAGH